MSHLNSHPLIKLARQLHRSAKHDGEVKELKITITFDNGEVVAFASAGLHEIVSMATYTEGQQQVHSLPNEEHDHG